MHDGARVQVAMVGNWRGVQSKCHDDGGYIADLDNTQQSMQIRNVSTRRKKKTSRKHNKVVVCMRGW